MYNTSHGLKDVENAGHKMAIVREPCNVDTHVKILALLKTMLCTQLCVRGIRLVSWPPDPRGEGK